MRAATSNPRSLPAQMVSKKVKESDEWQEKNMDRLDSIAYYQLMDNMRLLENYRMVKGEFIFDHYFDTDQYADIISQLTTEFKLPRYLKHYDIISPIINTFSGEMQEHPDLFKVRRYDEAFSSVFIREKTRMLREFVQEQMQAEIESTLAQMGYDTSGKSINFDSPEQQQQYMQEIEQKKQALTPPEIEKYMVTDWNDITEMYGQHRLDFNKEHYNVKEMERIEFEDVLTSARAYRHFFLTSDSFMQETLNTILTFYHKSPDIPNVEDGDYAGVQYYMSPSAIIARHGSKMTANQIKMLDNYDETYNKDGKNQVNGYGIEENSIMPFSDYPYFKMQTEGLGYDPYHPIEPLADDFWNTVPSGRFALQAKGLVRCVEGYWRSKKQKGYYCYFDPEIQQVIKVLVDEDFIPPPGTKIYKDEVWSKVKDTPGTLVWTYEDEIWQGVKVCAFGADMKDDMYIGVEACALQLEHDHFAGVKKIPIVSCFLNARNTEPVSVVDLIKPDQIGHNIAMNQGTQLMEREIGRFMVLDVNMLPRFKDWMGEDGYIKFTETARSLGVTIADTSPANMKGANGGGQLPKMIDLDETARILSRFRIADTFEIFAKRRAGVSEQRMGDIGKDETATGVNQSISKSYTQTRSTFTSFFDYKRRCLKMELDVSLHVDQQRQEFTMNYVRNDLTRAFFQIEGDKLSGVKLGLYVSNSQEAVRQMNLMQQLFMNNNNTDISSFDLASIVTANSPAEIKVQLKASDAKKQQMQDQAQQLEQQKQEQAKEMYDEKMKWEKESFYAKLESDERRTFMQTFNRQPDNLQDTNADSIPDVLEYDKFMTALTESQQKHAIDKEKVEVSREKINSDKQIARLNANTKVKEMRSKEKIAAENKNKYDTKSKKK